jgi:hypothetical protein
MQRPHFERSVDFLQGIFPQTFMEDQCLFYNTKDFYATTTFWKREKFPAKKMAATAETGSMRLQWYQGARTKCPKTKMSENQNVRKPKCQKTEMSKNQNVKKLKCQKTKMSKTKMSRNQNVQTPNVQNQNVQNQNVQSQ